MDLAQILPFLQEVKSGVWRELLDTFGEEEAYRLALLGRAGAMIELRTHYGWALEQVGGLFDLTRERVRQLTPPGLWAKPIAKPEMDLARVLQKAAITEGAWDKKGTLLLEWISKEAGYLVHYEDIKQNLVISNQRHIKFGVILQYGVGLADREAMLNWLDVQYYQHKKTYSDIAKMLQKEMVEISTMAIWRGAKALGFKGRSPGTYERDYYLEESGSLRSWD